MRRLWFEWAGRGGLLACFAGGAAFWFAGLPAPWLTGAAVAGAALALRGWPPAVPWQLQEMAFLVLGVSLGALVDPGSLAAAERWPLSLLALILTVPLIVGSAQQTLTRFYGWERREAFLASVPGALSYTLAIAVDEGLDVRPIAIAQSVRLMAIVLLVPLFFGFAAPQQPESTLFPTPIRPLEWLALLAAGLAAGLLLQRIKTPVALMIGGLIVSCIAHGLGLAIAPMPSWLLVPSIVVIGANVGARFGGGHPKALVAMLAPALASTAVTFLAAALAAVVTAQTLQLPMLQVLLAFAPGGLDTIGVLVFTLKLDAAYVTIHQLVRFLGIAATLPLMFRLWTTRKAKLPNS